MSNPNAIVGHRPCDKPIALPAFGVVAALAAIGIALSPWAAARAAELQLRPECRCCGPVVTLGDVADVLAADSAEADALAAVELSMPAADSIPR